jgi:hypothetical protein
MGFYFLFFPHPQVGKGGPLGTLADGFLFSFFSHPQVGKDAALGTLANGLLFSFFSASSGWEKRCFTWNTC